MNFKQFINDLFVKRIEKKSNTLFVVRYRSAVRDDWKEKQFNNYKEAQEFYLKKLAKVNTNTLFITQNRGR